MTVSVLRAGTLCLCLLLSAAARGYAQTPPPAAPPPPQTPQAEIGFVSPYEITRTVRSAGFSPLAPPLREGTTYVLRATDFHGVLMRVVVDARTGVIRDANRIVPDSGQYGQIGVDFDAPAPPAANTEPPLARPPAARILTPPLPRPRPAALVSRNPNAAANDQPKADPQ